MAKKSDKPKVTDIKLLIEEVKALMSKHNITDNNYAFGPDGPYKLDNKNKNNLKI